MAESRTRTPFEVASENLSDGRYTKVSAEINRRSQEYHVGQVLKNKGITPGVDRSRVLLSDPQQEELDEAYRALGEELKDFRYNP